VAYDGRGRLVTVTDPAGGVTQYAYDTSHQMLTLKDARQVVFFANECDARARVSSDTGG
jgi:YD repeat-containing protein